jgi:hypothetical protein
MSFTAILQAVGFFALAFAIGIYTWRGLRKGKILVGIRGGRKTWMVRKDDPVSFWIVILLLGFAAATILWVAISGHAKLSI